MTIREQIEEREYEILSPYAQHARESKGRKVQIEQCDIRTCYQRDRDRIIHSKSFRRLKNKTQVFLEPEGDHYRTRMTHTLEVSQIARTIAKALSLNEDLTEAIALGHDLGHTPYGHSGEHELDSILKERGFLGFKHNLQSVKLVEFIERDGEGLNLSYEVVDGIKNHGTRDMPETLEGKIVRLSDKIAYVNHDIDDALRAGVLKQENLPEEHTKVLGYTVKSRLNRMIHDMITNSAGKNDILMSEEVLEAMLGLRRYMFAEVYTSSVVKGEEQKAQEMLRRLFFFYMDHLELIPKSYYQFLDREAPELVIADYISGMTDQFAVQKYEEFFVPRGWQG